MLKSIDIGSVLNQFDLSTSDDGVVKTFGIRFVTADGRISEIYDARKNVKNYSQDTEPTSSGLTKQKYNLKRHGAMKLFNENTEEWRDVKVAHMVQFRPHNSKVWLPIYH